MDERRLPSAADAEVARQVRVRLLSPWAMLGIVVAVCGVLYLLFPKQSLLEQIRAERGNDALTAGYLAALLRSEPANHELRLLIAEKHFAMGQFEPALEAAEPAMLSPDPALRRRVILLEFQILQAEAAAALPGRPEHAAIRTRLGQHLSRYVGEDWPPRRLIEFSRAARASQLHKLAAAFDDRLVSSELNVRPEWLDEAAQGALGDGGYVAAARLYFAAQRRAVTRADRRDYFLKGVATLRSGNLLGEALAAADKEIGDLRDDEPTLAYLARLALAAGEPARAQTYMKRLLHLSQGRLPLIARRIVTPAALAEALVTWLVASAHASQATTSDAPVASAPGLLRRPYDEALYTLAFDVFIANGNVIDAWRVADAAVAQRPDDLVWRRRLAQTSEWSGKPQDALMHWLLLARRTDAEDAWQGVLRLAPGLQDDEALLIAWKREASRRALTSSEWQRISNLYESLGRPAEGIAFFKDQYERRRDAAILDIVATLEERSGHLDDAIATLERLLAQAGPDSAQAVRLATLLFLRSDFARAYRALQPLQGQTPSEDTAYWKLLADLAWQMQDDGTAADAYGRLQVAGNANANDIERLVQLLRPGNPDEARRMALFSWRKFRSMSGFMFALELANEQRDYDGMKMLIGEVSPEDETRLAGNGFYFTLRAVYFQAIGERGKAMAEYRRAMAANPGNTDLRLSYLWLLIDARETAELRQRLLAWGGEVNAVWWDAYAAGYQVLGEPKRALPWLSRQTDRRAGDYLWLANYAEVLAEAGQAGMADRVRRHAWIQARIRLRDQPSLAAQRESMLAYARLALRNVPGDGSLNAMRRLLRQDTAPSIAVAKPIVVVEGKPAPEIALDNAVNELVLAWSLGEEQIEAARQWMWSRFARRVEAPAWADIGLALAERDRERLVVLLDDEKRVAALPDSARIDAARETGRLRLAQSLAFFAQRREPDNADIHLRLATDLLATASSVIFRETRFERGVVQGHEQSARLQVWATPQLRLALDINVLHQHTGDAGQLTGVPGVDRTLGVSALWHHGGGEGGKRGESELTLTSRSGLSQFVSLRFAHLRPLGERITGSIGLTIRDRATESVALGVGGHKNEASVALNYRLSGREYLSGRLWQARFHTQQDSYLGRGRGVSAEAGYRVRTEYPDFNVRVSRVVSSFEAGTVSDLASAVLVPGATTAPPAAFFMPQSFRLWGINAGFGTDIREQRSRALRPFADFGRTASSTSGSGYNWVVGAGGSVVGTDHLAIYSMRARGGGIGAAVRELGLRYQYYFD